MANFLLNDYLKLDESGITKIAPQEMVAQLTHLFSSFGEHYIMHEEIVSNIREMLAVMEPYKNYNDTITVSQDAKQKYNEAYNRLAKIFQEERRFKRLLSKLDQHRKDEGSLSDYQEKLRRIINLAAQDKQFATLLDRRQFLSIIEEYNSTKKPEGELERWLGIKEYDDTKSAKEIDHQRCLEIIEHWCFYVLFQSPKYQDAQKIDQLLTDLKDAYSDTTKTLGSKIEEANTEISKIKSVTQLIDKDYLLPAYSEQFQREASEHQKQSKKWERCLWLAVIAFIGIILLAYLAEIPEDIIPENGPLAEGIAVDTLTLTIKVAIIIAWLQVIRFIHKKYFALCHLYQMASHKSKTLKSIQAIVVNTDDAEMNKILLMAGAAEVFRSYETGYLSRKEGGGSFGSIDIKDFLQKIKINSK